MEEDILEIVRKEDQLQLEKYGKGKRKGSKLEASETKKKKKKAGSNPHAPKSKMMNSGIAGENMGNQQLAMMVVDDDDCVVVTLGDIFGADYTAPLLREPLNNLMYTKLRKFSAMRFSPYYVQGTTFEYIYMFKVEGVVHDQLDVALREYGYTMEEVDAMTLSQIVSELLSRGIRNDLWEAEALGECKAPNLDECDESEMKKVKEKGQNTGNKQRKMMNYISRQEYEKNCDASTIKKYKEIIGGHFEEIKLKDGRLLVVLEGPLMMSELPEYNKEATALYAASYPDKCKPIHGPVIVVVN